MAIYRHFEAKFQTMVIAFYLSYQSIGWISTTFYFQKVEEYGTDRMKADVKSLKELNAEARQRCVLSEGDRSHMDKNSLYKPYSNQVVGFNIR